jgi:hypothetical protein
VASPPAPQREPVAEAEDEEPAMTADNPRIAFRSKVLDVSKKDRIVGARKEGDEVVVDRRDLGWTILLEGSRERLFVGDDHPGFEAGDPVLVTIEKEQRS